MTLAWPAAAVLGASFLGAVHPAGDTLAVFRPLLLLIFFPFALLIFWLRGRLFGILGLLLCALALWTMWPPAADRPGDGQSISVYQKNLSFRLDDRSDIVTDILASGADFVTLQEVHKNNRDVLAELEETYPHQHSCPFAAVGGVALLSRWNIVDNIACGEGEGMAAALVDTGRHRVWAVALHLHWPWPQGQPAQIEALLPRLERMEEPVVLAGDFNMVPWSDTLGRIRDAGSLDMAGFVGSTFKLDIGMPLQIDHVLMPRGSVFLGVRKRPDFGSDHNGVLSTFMLP